MTDAQKKHATDLSDVQDQVLTLTKDNAALQDKIDAADRKAEQISKASEDRLVAQQKTSDDQIKTLTQEKAELEGKLGAADVRLSSKVRVLEAKETELAGVKKKLHLAAQRGFDATKLNADLQKQLEKSKASEESARKELASAQQKVKEGTEQVRPDNPEFENIKKERDVAMQAQQELEVQLADVKKSLGDATDGNKQLEAQVAEYKKKLGKSYTAKRELETKLEEGNEVLDILKSRTAEVEKLEKENAELKAMTRELEAKSIQLENEKADADQLNENLSDAVDTEIEDGKKEKARADTAEARVKVLDGVVKREHRSKQDAEKQVG